MALVVNESAVTAESLAAGVWRQPLLTEARVKGARILLDRWTLARAASAALDVPASNLAWFQVLEGEATLRHADGEQQLTRARDPGAQLRSGGEPPGCLKQ